MTDKKRVQVSFTDNQWEMIEELKDSFGATDAEAVRNIVIAWLAEKSFISNKVKKEGEIDE